MGAQFGDTAYIMEVEPLLNKLDTVVQSGGSEAVFESLVEAAHAESNYPLLFEVRVMQARYRLGLAPIAADGDVPSNLRPAYDEALVRAARETANLLLASGQIEAAWRYFEAIGDTVPIAEAIQNWHGPEPVPDRVIELAFYRGVNPLKGFELILNRHGLCSALTAFSHYQDAGTRDRALGLLVSALHTELAISLRRTIAEVEASQPEAQTVRELIEGRDWLFGEYSQYVDSTHLAGILPHCRETEDADTLAKALELAEYGIRLAPLYQFGGEPPFEQIYLDHAVYFRAILGQDVDGSVEHFRGKLAAPGSERISAEALVQLLVRLGRPSDAVDVSLQYLGGDAGDHYPCPSAVQLCQMAGDSGRLSQVARERRDPISYAAALLMSRSPELDKPA